MSSLMDRMRKAGAKGIDATVATKSETLKNVGFAPTKVPMLNVALSGRLDGGLQSGFTMFAGPSKHYKSNLTLICVAAYLDAHPDAIAIFWDCEFGITEDYFLSAGVDPDRVLHVPITSVEELKFDMMKRLGEIQRGDKVIGFIDSIGQLASKKEIEDALDEKSVADMTRAKSLKSLFRMVVPHLKVKDIPLIGINHTYETIEMHSTQKVGGGTGAYYGADTIFILGRQQVKDGKDLTGYNFIINVEKGRFVKEKSKIPLLVTFDDNVCVNSGLLEVAIHGNFVTAPKQGWYTRSMVADDKNWRRKELEQGPEAEEFWAPVLADPEFQKFVKNLYSYRQEEAETIDFDPDTGEVLTEE